ncbi:MAG: protein kinase, partial [Anaerolineaceae bacterium]
MSDLPGQYIGRYHITEKIGVGGMATVYKAFDSRLERDVALKVIRSDIVRDEMFLKRFEREAKALARLSHPNIVKVLDYGEHEGSPYLVMEYMRGDTLKKLLGRPMPWREAARLLMPIAEALAYTHKQGIVHRDVKPSNFLMTDSNHLMLSDFGIAKMLDNPEAVQLTGTGVGVGTPEYMAPEQGLGETVDQRADIYALGVVFYEMVTGQKPYRADTPMAVMYKQITDPLPPPRQYVPDLPEQVELILFKALAKKPVDRFQNMGEFAQALQEVIENANSTATRMFSAQPLQGQTSPAQTAYRPAEQHTPTPPPFQTGQPATGSPSHTPPPFQTGMPQTAASPSNPAIPLKKNKRLGITCGVLAFVAVCIAVAALTGGFNTLMSMLGVPPAGLSVEVTLPPSIQMGREFQAVVSMRNDSSKEIKVTEIQLPKPMQQIASINTTSPLYSNTTASAKDGGTGYVFNLTLAPGATREVTFYFNPRQTADITDNWNVLVGSRRAVTPVRVLITEAAAQAPTPTAQPTPTEAAPTQAPAPTETIQGVNPSEWSEVWVDDFSDPNSGFYTGQSTDRKFAYENGTYRIDVIQKSWMAWMYLGYSLTDVQVNADIKMSNKTTMTAYGMVCRYDANDNFYGFEFSEDGYYTIWLRYNNEYTTLVEWTYDSRIDATQWQKMTIECVGDQLTLKFNDEVVATATDATIASGDVGLLAESDES